MNLPYQSCQVSYLICTPSQRNPGQPDAKTGTVSSSRNEIHPFKLLNRRTFQNGADMLMIFTASQSRQLQSRDSYSSCDWLHAIQHGMRFLVNASVEKFVLIHFATRGAAGPGFRVRENRNACGFDTYQK